MAVRTLVDTDSVQIVSSKWLTDVRQYSDNLDTIAKHGTINAALSNIGTATQTTLLVTKPTAVNANTDLTSYPNISWLFLGSGRLVPATGVTLTLYSGDTIECPPYQQCLDASSGTIAFAKSGWVWPGWFGATPGASASAGKTALQKLAAAFGSVGGGIYWPGHTIQADDTIAFTGPVTILGIHADVSIFESTANASLKHGLTFTRSHTIKNLTIRTSTDLTTDQQMYGVRMNLDGVTVSGGNLAVRWENVRVRGFNNSLYVDGGDSYNVDQVSFSGLDLKCAGPASTYIGSCLYVHRVNQLDGTISQFDQNDTGEHAIYCFGSKNIVFDGFKIRNATKGEAQAIKVVGNGAPPDDDQAYPTWSIRNMDIADCLNGVLCGTYGTETLEALAVENCKFVDVDSSTGILAPVYASAADSSNIRSVRVQNISHRNGLYQGVHLSAGTSATIGQAVVLNCTAYNWGAASAGSYTWFGTSGNGTFGPITLDTIAADGNSNGRAIVGSTGQAAGVTRIKVRNLSQSNTTNPGLPIADSGTSATFDFAIGNAWTVSGTRTVTAASHAVPGEVYTIIGTNANCTFTDNAVYALNGNWVSAANKTLTLQCLTASTFVELARSTN